MKKKPAKAKTYIDRVEITGIEYTAADDTFNIEYDVEFTTRDYLLFELIRKGRQLTKEGNPPKVREAGEQMLTAADLFDKYLMSIEFTPRKTNYKYNLNIFNIPAEST